MESQITAETKSATTGLYPDLTVGLDDHDDDIITALVEPKRKKPARPPPPRSQSLPERNSPFDAILNDDGMDIPGVKATPTSVVPASGRTQSLSAASETVPIPSPLTSEEIRWFFQEPGKFWQPFSGPDSLSIEECYSKLMSGDLMASGKGGGDVGDVAVMGDLFEVNVFERKCRSVYWAEKETWPVLRGYWYEVISDKWYPVPEEDYRKIEESHVQKAWREKVKADEDLQQWAETVSGSKVNPGSQTDGPSKIKPTEVILNKLVLERYEVLWMANGDVRKLKKEISTQLWNKVGSKLGKGQSYGATKLVRGYKEVATLDGQLAPIGHVVFIIHGIGQSMDLSCINKSTSDFRQTCVQVAKRQFKDKWNNKRVEFIPVEWRTWLSLDKGILNTITPQGVKMLRTLFNESVLDVLYYMSPKFGPEIRDGLRFALHKQYAHFIKRHPSFLSEGGTVSVIAHSLGSVIMYDLLLETCKAKGINHGDPMSVDSTSDDATGATFSKASPVVVKESDNGFGSVKFTSRLVSPESSLSGLEQDGKDEPDSTCAVESGFDEAAARLELEQLKKRVAELEEKLGTCHKPQGLNFFMDHFFALGSPLAVFLMLREHEQLIKRSHKSAESLLPSCVCSRIHNVHHPSDPVAYRLEPLIHPAYTQVKPVRIDSAGSKLSKDSIDHAEGTRSKPPMQTSQGKSWFSTLALFGSSSSSKKPASSPETSKSKATEKVVDSDKNLKPEDKLKERLDFMLKESFAESSYINSLTAHTGYWTSQDCAQYVLLQLYSYKR